MWQIWQKCCSSKCVNLASKASVANLASIENVGLKLGSEASVGNVTWYSTGMTLSW